MSSWVPPAAGSAPDPVPETLPGFSGWQQIGRGGDAIVYRAVQDDLGREVAIKVLTVDDEESVRRFTREVQLMVALGRQHPNIAKVLQIGTSSLGRPCIVMDFYELGSLDKRLSHHGALGADEVISVGTVIADALAFAHSKGVLHRDVKPQNILILPTSYVLADFGIARLIDAAHTASSDRFSYRHASPQVLDGFPPSESDDIFSLGATMFHLLDGKPPFTTTTPEPDSPLAYIKRVRIAEPRLLTRTDVPDELKALIYRCLRKNPEERFGSAAELRNELARLRHGWAGVSNVLPPVAPPPAAAVLPETAGRSWGGTPGQLHSTDDLTSMRFSTGAVTGPPPLGPPSARSAASGATASPPMLTAHTPNELIDAPPARRVPRLSIILGGVAIGVLVVVVLWTVLRPQPGPNVLPATTPRPAAPTATAGSSPTVRSNPNLAPRNLKVELVGNQAAATWDKPVDEPERYLWGVTPDPEQEPQEYFRNVPSERTATADIDPSWRRVCFLVVGQKEAQLGPERECVQR